MANRREISITLERTALTGSKRWVPEGRIQVSPHGRGNLGHPGRTNDAFANWKPPASSWQLDGLLQPSRVRTFARHLDNTTLGFGPTKQNHKATRERKRARKYHAGDTSVESKSKPRQPHQHLNAFFQTTGTLPFILAILLQPLAPPLPLGRFSSYIPYTAGIALPGNPALSPPRLGLAAVSHTSGILFYLFSQSSELFDLQARQPGSLFHPNISNAATLFVDPGRYTSAALEHITLRQLAESPDSHNDTNNIRPANEGEEEGEEAVAYQRTEFAHFAAALRDLSRAAFAVRRVLGSSAWFQSWRLPCAMFPWDC